MPRPKADIRISIKVHGKPTRKLELIRQPFRQRFWVWVDGQVSSMDSPGLVGTSVPMA